VRPDRGRKVLGPKKKTASPKRKRIWRRDKRKMGKLERGIRKVPPQLRLGPTRRKGTKHAGKKKETSKKKAA